MAMAIAIAASSLCTLCFKMSPFKNCILSSQQILHKSFYLNPFSDSQEHTLNSSTMHSTSSCSSTISAPPRVMKDQATLMTLRSLKENEPPTLGRHSEAKAGKEVRTRRPSDCVGKREPLRPLRVPRRTLKGVVVEGHPQEGIVKPNNSQQIEQIASLFIPPTPTHFLSHMWDDPDCEVAPASAWSTLGNRTLLCRPLPIDVGRCACYITRERKEGLNGYALFTDEGHGRQDRKLAVAHHRRRAGRSEFVVYPAGIGGSGVKSEAVLGKVQANLLGSRYSIWGERQKNGLAPDWEENANATNVNQLFSRKPYYNKVTRRYELDFRDRVKRASKIKASSTNLQLTMNENGKQAILMLGKIEKSKYVMEYRFPLTAYQAFSICLASMDSKLCCSL